MRNVECGNRRFITVNVAAKRDKEIMQSLDSNPEERFYCNISINNGIIQREEYFQLLNELLED